MVGVVFLRYKIFHCLSVVFFVQLHPIVRVAQWPASTRKDASRREAGRATAYQARVAQW